MKSAVQFRRALTTIVFTDVVGSSARMRADEAGTVRIVQRDLNLIRTTCQRHGGLVQDIAGDGALLLFDNAMAAVQFAIDVQRALRHAAKGKPASEVLHHRIGIHLGDLVRVDSKWTGDAVNLASRINGVATPDRICISDAVHAVVQHQLKIPIRAMGAQNLKGFPEPIELFEISPIDARVEHRALRPAQRRRLVALGASIIAIGIGAAILRYVLHPAHPQQQPAVGAASRGVPEGNLDPTLRVEVQRDGHWLPITLAGPLLNGDLIRLHAQVPARRFASLVLIDSTGSMSEIASLPAVETNRDVWFPAEDKASPLTAPAGTEAIFLLTRQGQAIDIASLGGHVGPASAWPPLPPACIVQLSAGKTLVFNEQLGLGAAVDVSGVRPVRAAFDRVNASLKDYVEHVVGIAFSHGETGSATKGS